MAPKAEKKKQDKIIEDRTFGLKNKNKSKAVQKFVKGVENTVKNGGKSANQLQSQKFQNAKLKKKAEEEAALLNSLYKDVNKIREQEEEEEDPKNTVCPYFKQGLCQKGKKCIYSHDLALDRTEEIDLYVDQRTQLIMNQIGSKNLNDLSEEELNQMITNKEKNYIKGMKSDIVCKHFLEAVEKSKYGWNWACPNGGDSCKYKHCLPPGYILNKDGGNVKIAVEEVNIEEKIDEQRSKLNKQGSPLVTLQVFMKWKADKIKRKKEEEEKKRKEEEKKNKNKGNLRTGKQLFTYDPTLFVDDEEAAADYDEREQLVEEEEEVKNEYRGDEEDEEKNEQQTQQQNETGEKNQDPAQ